MRSGRIQCIGNDACGSRAGCGRAANGGRARSGRAAPGRGPPRGRKRRDPSLADILDALRGKLPGDVAGIEIEHEGGHWRYEFRVVDSQGRLFEIYVDARSGKIERIEEK